MPPIRRDLVQALALPGSKFNRRLPRGCPFVCDFCYKEAFYQGGKSFYTQRVEDALKEIDRLPGRHLYFLDDHIFGDRRFSSAPFSGMRGMGRIWQAAGTVNSILETRIQPHLMEEAVASGLRSLFVGFETINAENLHAQRKFQNQNRDYAAAIRRLKDLGVMINGSFVFGMDDDRPDVFDRTVEWAVQCGIETATFHILTPYPGTGTFKRMESQGRLLHRNWDLYDPPYGLQTREDDSYSNGRRLLEFLPKLLQLAQHRQRGSKQINVHCCGPARRLLCRLEEI